MLSELFLNKLERSLLSVDDLKLAPSIGERKEWETVDEDLKNEMIKKAEEYLEFGWPLLTASKRMIYVRTGNRKIFENLYMERRTALGHLVLGECLENEGRFIDDIINGIWCICEETNWLLPAHNKDRNFRVLTLPDIKNNQVEIFVAETAELLTYVYCILKISLDKITPLICERIEYEIRRNLLNYYMERDDFSWMGFTKNSVGNHNPWVNFGTLTAFLVFEKDFNKRVEGVKKTIRSIDNFLNAYKEDGGCDEGAGYWMHAAGKLFNYLDLLFRATNGQLDAFHLNKIKEMGKFLYHVHISGNYFVNFADGQAKLSIPTELVYRYGKRIDDEYLYSLAVYLFKNSRNKIPEASWLQFTLALNTVLHSRKLMDDTSKIRYKRDSWLPCIQVMCAREKEDSDMGFYLAAKGGHNREHHNHNDVGNFIIFYNGKPCIIDAGVEAYSAKTFSKDRYSIWTMQSAYHNLPTVNGVMQADGYDYKAVNVSYKNDKSGAELCQNIEQAYPKESGIETWKRKIIMNRQRHTYIDVIDDFKLNDYTEDVTLTIMTLYEPSFGNGMLEFKNSEIKGVKIEFDKSKFVAEIEKIVIDDKVLLNTWGGNIYRILLKACTPMKKDISKIRISSGS